MEGQGQVSISAAPASAPGRVVVRIEDDGIGLEESQRSKSGAENDHISRGIEITKGRADVLRRLELTDIRIDGPKDRLNGSGQRRQGTLVSIELPVNQGVKNRAEGLEPAQSDPTFEA